MKALLLSLFFAPVLVAQAADPVPHFSQVDEGVMRGGRPKTEAAMSFLRDHGVRTIINIQGDSLISPLVGGESRAERKWQEELALRYGYSGDTYVNVPVRATRMPGREEIPVYLDIVEKMRDPRLQPVFVHCNVGADRTGFIVALYRMIEQNCSYEAAYKELRSSGHLFTPLFTTLLRPLLRDVSKGEGGLGVKIRRGTQTCPL